MISIDPGSFVVYGVPWMIVGMALLFTINFFLKTKISETVERVFQAGWAVIGYFLVNNLEPIEQLWPSMPIILPQILTAILLFGGMLGFRPGGVFRRVRAWFVRR